MPARAEWHAWDRVHASENDEPDAFGGGQLFVVEVLQDGGADLEHLTLRDAQEVAPPTCHLPFFLLFSLTSAGHVRGYLGNQSIKHYSNHTPAFRTHWHCWWIWAVSRQQAPEYCLDQVVRMGVVGSLLCQASNPVLGSANQGCYIVSSTINAHRTSGVSPHAISCIFTIRIFFKAGWQRRNPMLW